MKWFKINDKTWVSEFEDKILEHDAKYYAFSSRSRLELPLPNNIFDSLKEAKHFIKEETSMFG